MPALQAAGGPRRARSARDSPVPALTRAPNVRHVMRFCVPSPAPPNLLDHLADRAHGAVAQICVLDCGSFAP